MIFRTLRNDDAALVEQFATLASRRDPPRYSSEWGRPGDTGVAAFDGSAAVGVVWVRLFRDAVAPADPNIPEMAVAVDEERRNAGVGASLLQRLIALLKVLGYPYVDLSVSRDNGAARTLYERLGFVEIHRAADGRSWMRCSVG